jgi:hypothetical protein
MLRGATPAAVPTGTVGCARATPELHGAVRCGTAGCGLNRDHWGRARAAVATRRRMHISAPPAARPFGDRGPRAGRRSCATRSGPTSLRMRISAPPAAGPARGSWAASGPEVIELLIDRCSTTYSIMHTAATVVVPHTAKGVTHDKRWAMEDLVYSSLPHFILFRSE